MLSTQFRTEFLAGLTTFVTMAYIVIVNPMMLSQAGMDYNAVFTATCLSAALGSVLMGLLGKYPIALAPSMSLNAYFSFYVVQQLHFSWQSALGIVFIAGLLFALLTGTQIRQWLIYAMPHSLKMAVAAGIGLFLIVIAMKSLGLQFASSNFLNVKIWLCLLAVFLTVILERFKIIGAILISMLIVSLIGVWLGLVKWTGFISMPPSITPTLFQLQIPPLHLLHSWVIILIFLFVTLFDNTGTLIAILHQAHLLPQDRQDVKSQRLGKALLADSLAAMSGALLGTSSTGSYIESAAGVRAGGRTGLTAIIVGLLFIVALFFAPLAKAIPDYASASALIYVGMLMTTTLRAIEWRKISESLPALLTILVIPLTFSIAQGICVGFISYVLIKTMLRKTNELSIGLWLIGGVSLLYMVTALCFQV